MTVRLYLLVLLWSGLIMLQGCANGKKDQCNFQEFVKFINDPDNGLIKERKANGLRLTVKYLPEDYLLYKDLKDESDKSETLRDSLRNYYKNNAAFLLTISPDTSGQAERGDIMFKGLNSFEEYKDRAHQMNFQMDDYISLASGEDRLKPALTTMENIYGLDYDRSIYVLFAPVKDKGEIGSMHELDFIFNDELFMTGTNHFVFRKEDINNIPTLTF